MKLIEFLLGTVAMIGTVLIVAVVAVKITIATFVAVTSIAAPIVAYAVAIFVFCNLVPIVIGLAWLVCCAFSIIAVR